MNLKKAFLSFMAAGAILAGGMGGAVAQNSDSAQGQVQVNVSGTFNVFICHTNATSNELINFQAATLSSQNPIVKKQAQMVICYTDTKPHRGAFKTYLSSSNFFHSDNWYIQIDKSNLKPVTIYNVGQGQWSSHALIDYAVGDIGGRTSAGTSVNSGSGTPWGPTTFGEGQLWVGHGNAGVGTGSNFYRTFPDSPYGWDSRSENGAWAPIDLELNVPSTTQQGLYQNTFTVDVVFDAPAG